MDHSRILLTVSSEDPAGVTFRDVLVDRFGFRRISEGSGVTLFRDAVGQFLTSIHVPPIYSDDLEHRLDNHIARQASAYIFLTKHYSKEGVPALTAHFPGNPQSEARFGGRPREVAIIWPSLLKNYFRRLWTKRESLHGFDIVMEATHHGPTALSKPVMFVELGSTEREWQKKDVAYVILETLLESLSRFEASTEVALGLGGPHYCHRFMKLLLDGPFALAGVIAKYSLDSFDRQILDQFLARSIEPITHVAIDWKGLSGRVRNQVVEWAAERGLQTLRL